MRNLKFKERELGQWYLFLQNETKRPLRGHVTQHLPHALNHPPQGLFLPTFSLKEWQGWGMWVPGADRGWKKQNRNNVLSFPQPHPVVSLLLLQSVLLSSCHYFQLSYFYRWWKKDRESLGMNSRCCARKYRWMSQKILLLQCLWPEMEGDD